MGWTVSNDELRIIKVLPNQPAAVAGIRPGMRVVDINGITVVSVPEMKAALASGTVFNVTVEMPPQQAGVTGGFAPTAVGAQVAVHGVAAPANAVTLNGLTGRVTGRGCS